MNRSQQLLLLLLLEDPTYITFTKSVSVEGCANVLCLVQNIFHFYLFDWVKTKSEFQEEAYINPMMEIELKQMFLKSLENVFFGHHYQING